MGTQQGEAIHVIYNDFGSQAAKNFIDDIQQLVNHFLIYISSFSVGIGDCVADPITVKHAKNNIQNEVDSIINMVKRNELETFRNIWI